MTRAQHLQDLTAKLKHLSSQLDPEAAHRKADRILLQAFQVVTQYDPELVRHAQDLTNAFDRLEKWYS